MMYGSMRHTSSGRKKKTNYWGKKRKKQPEFREMDLNKYIPKHESSADEIQSVDTKAGVAAKKESQKYTGDLVKGIGTMHKSNAVPVIDDEFMKDLARMRR